MDDGFIPAFILRNSGVPIDLYRLDENGQRMTTGEGEEQIFVIQSVHLRFDANAVAQIEDLFDGFRASEDLIEEVPLLGLDGEQMVGDAGPLVIRKKVGSEERVFYGVEGFQKALSTKPFDAVRRVLAVAFGTDPETMGRRLVDGAHIDYQNAVGVAWAMAQGVDPSDAATMLHKARAGVAAARDSLASRLTETLVKGSDETTEPPGMDGFAGGSPSYSQ